MPTQYLMQSKRADTAALVTWLSDLPDFSGIHYSGPGTLSASDTAVSGGGIESSSSTPNGAMTYDDGSLVVFDDGSFAITT